MADWSAVRHVVVVAGRVSDAQTGNLIAGARVSIISGPPEFAMWLSKTARAQGERWDSMEERPDRTRTRGDGHFHFSDLPDGTYTLSAGLPRAGSRWATASVSVIVKRDENGHVAMAQAPLELPPTTVKGAVIANGGAPVVMAEVVVRGSGERTFTDVDGHYLLSGLEIGSRVVRFSASGYESIERNIDFVIVGSEVVLDVSLSPAGP